jgi:hypothetical protein
MILTIGAKSAGKQVSPLIRRFSGLHYRAYLERYLALAPNPRGRPEIECWRPVVAAARLNEQIAPEREALRQIVEEGLQ